MIMLTGATGAAGSLIAGEFVTHREPLKVLVRDRAKAKRLLDAPTVKVVEGDMAERSSLAAALEGVDRVLMISGPTMDMVETQCAFIDACKAADVRHVLVDQLLPPLVVGDKAGHLGLLPAGLAHCVKVVEGLALGAGFRQKRVA